MTYHHLYSINTNSGNPVITSSIPEPKHEGLVTFPALVNRFRPCDCMHNPMRPKARGLAQNAGPPGWLEKSDPAGRDFISDGRSISPALTDHTACLGLGLLNYERLAIPAAAAGAGRLLNVHKIPKLWKSPMACRVLFPW
jgi:hypothetical protein